MSPRSRSRRPQTSAWDGLVVISSGTSWDGAFLSDKQLALHLTRHAPVLFVDPPISVLTPLRRPELSVSSTTPGLREIGDRLMRLTPLAPPGVSRPGLRRLALTATRRAMGSSVARLGGRVEALVVGTLDDVFESCGERRSVLWGTDDFAAAGELMGLSSTWLARREQHQLARASDIVAVSDNLADKWRAMGHDVTVIPNGCDTKLFARAMQTDPAPDVRLPSPIAAFVGHLSDRIDLATLTAVADTGASLLLVGPRQATFEMTRLDALFARPNVQWVGPRPFDQLPSYLRTAAVGLTPYADSPFNRSSYPLKTLEYFAAGLPAVSTDLPAARTLRTELLSIGSNPAEFAEHVVRRLADPASAGRVRQAQEYAVQHSWTARAQDFARLLGLTNSAEPEGWVSTK